MKQCRKCGELKPENEFYPSKGMADGFRSDCKACNLAAKRARYAANPQREIARVKQWQQLNKAIVNARNRAYREANPLAMREWHLRSKLGISIADYDELLRRQRGGCAVCHKPPGNISLHVDHDHVTGKIRGLLCVGCNNAIGQFHDDADLLARAIDYVTADVAPYVDSLSIHKVIRERARGLRGSPV
jgi:hypothetical protein